MKGKPSDVDGPFFKASSAVPIDRRKKRATTWSIEKLKVKVPSELGASTRPVEPGNARVRYSHCANLKYSWQPPLR